MSEGEKFICEGVCYTHEDVQNNSLTNFSKAPLICQIQQETLYLALEFSMKPTDN